MTTIQHQFFYGENEKTPEQKRAYNREYHSTYRKQNETYYEGLSLIRTAIKSKRMMPETELTLMLFVGMMQDELLLHLGLTNEHARRLFLAGDYEIDHILGAAWIRSHKEFEPYMHRWYNLRVVSKAANRSKKRYETTNEAKLIACKMVQELVEDLTIEGSI